MCSRGRARGGHPRAGNPVERIEAGDLAEGGAMAVLRGAMEIDRRPAIQRRAARIHLDRAGARKLADDDPLGAAQRARQPAHA